MIALRFILVSAILISSTMAKPKSYMSDGDSQGEQKSTISAILQHLRHLYDIVNEEEYQGMSVDEDQINNIAKTQQFYKCFLDSKCTKQIDVPDCCFNPANYVMYIDGRCCHCPGCFDA